MRRSRNNSASSERRIETRESEDEEIANVEFSEEGNDFVMQVQTQPSGMNSEDEFDEEDDDEFAQQQEELQAINNNAVEEVMETVSEVPPEFEMRSPAKKRHKSELEELKEIKATLSHFETMLGNNYLIKNPEFEPQKGKEEPSKSKRLRKGKEVNLNDVVRRKVINDSDSTQASSEATIYLSAVKLHSGVQETEPIFQPRNNVTDLTASLMVDADEEGEIQFNMNRISSSSGKMMISSDEYLNENGTNLVEVIDKEERSISDHFYDQAPRPRSSSHQAQREQ